MGVRRLQTYMEENCPGGCKVVDIAKMADDHNLTNSTPPVILVDGSSCVRILYDNLCWVLNGQWKEYVDKLKKFVEKFKDAGVELIFFFDAHTEKEKRKTWVERRRREKENTNAVFRDIRRGGIPNDELFHLPPGMALVTRMVLKFLCNCKVVNCSIECDREIVAYANKTGSLAILGQDSDYIIYNTVSYLSINKLDLKTMKTIMYDRNALANSLGLQLRQLPLFACLCGNDFVPYDALNDFRRQNTPHPKKNLGVAGYMKGIAQFVKRQPDFDSDVGIAKIVRNVFGVYAGGKWTEALKKAISTYNGQWESGQSEGEIAKLKGLRKKEGKSCWIFDVIEERHFDCQMHAFVYNILEFEDFDTGTSLQERESQSGFPAESVLFQPVRQACYAILETVKGSEVKVEEWCAAPDNWMERPEVVGSKRPKGVTIDLEQLWRAEKEERFATFFACFDVTFPSSLESIPEYYIPLVTILKFLIRNTRIKEWEVDAFIAQAMMLPSVDSEFLQKLKISSYEINAVYLSTLFMRGVLYVTIVLNTCNNPLEMKTAMPWNYFDGKLFHRCYLRAKNTPKNTVFVDSGERIAMPMDLFKLLKGMCYSNE